jgi:ribose transport system ATP-binding protein
LRQALEQGVAYLTEDRKSQGLALRLNMRENALSARIPWSGRGPLYRARAGEDILCNLIKDLQITPPNPRQLVRNLSGGNQQKVLLAKWLAVEPKVLILDEPTRGVDVGAKALIHEAILRLAAEGRAVLLISSDLPELTQLSHRILILRQGRLIGELPKERATEESLLLAANGVMEG